ncbi:MAG: GAF domain-containing protein [Anaerolineaceae bacterium]|nr:MAG: GAF domain-containing protein [Anaerolineaceae bacterium]
MISLATLQRILTLRYDYEDAVSRQRAQLLIYVLAGLIVIAPIIVLLGVFDAVTSQSGVAVETLGSLPPLLFALLSLYWVQTGRLYLASVVIAVVLLLNMVFIVGTFNLLDTALFVLTLLPVVLGSVLFDRREFIGYAVVTFLLILAMGALQFDGLGDYLAAGQTQGTLSVFVVLSLLLFITSGGLSDISRSNRADIQRYDRVAAFSSATNVSEMSEDVVFARALSLLRNDFGYAFAQMFLADERGRITERFRSGLTMRQGGTRTAVALPDASALIESLRSRTILTVSTQESALRRSHFLPASNYGLIVPLRVGDEIIGVLDVQKVEHPFSTPEINALKSLVDQTGMLTYYVRSFGDLRSGLDNLEATTQSLRLQLREYRRAESQVVGATWDSYMDMRHRPALGYDLSEAGITLAEDLPDDLAQVMEAGEIDIRDEGDARVVRAPITIRGEMIGAMAFTIPPDRPFGERQAEFIRSVSTRLALALENKRLFEASQAQALRERKAGAVAGELISATDVNDVVRIAAQRFNEALGAVATRIYLERDLVEDQPESSQSPASQPEKKQ